MPLQATSNPKRAAPRQSRRKQLLTALSSGLRVQGTLTAVTLSWIFFSGTLWRGLTGHTLLLTWIAVLLVPAWIGGFVSGFMAPGIRSRHLAAPALVNSLLFLAVSLVVPLKMPLELKLWLAFMLVLHPVITGTLGHYVRLRKDAADALKPRPWLASRAGAAKSAAAGSASAAPTPKPALRIQLADQD